MKQRWLWVLSFVLCACAPDDDPVPSVAPAVVEISAPVAADAEPDAFVAPASEVIALELPYGYTAERNLNGYFVLPADAVGALPAVIMIHEAWGLNDTVRAMARRLAGEGYAVLAVDLFAGELATSEEDAERLLAGLADARPAVLDNIRQARGYLEQSALAPSIAMLGWGFGGGWSLEAGIVLGDAIDAVVMYYGPIINTDEGLRPLTAPLLGIFAARDESISVNDVQRFRRRLRELGKTAEVLIYTGVGHAFADPGSTTYDPQTAEEAWEKTLEFLQAQLRRSQ
jgi:carboxymethylenebutenolidase